MNEEAWYANRNSRSMRYAGRLLNPSKNILIRAEHAYAKRYDGQVAIITAANLLSRMTPAVALDIPSVPIVNHLPWAGKDLREFVLDMMFKTDPYGRFSYMKYDDAAYVIHLGRTGSNNIIHGTGWNIYLGQKPSPLENENTPNPIGPALASIFAVTEAFKSDLKKTTPNLIFNALTWESKFIQSNLYTLPIFPDLGVLWTVGTGSVGTAILYFLALITNNFSVSLFDMDKVGIHNMDRSPIFIAIHEGEYKVHATAEFLRHVGIQKVLPYTNSFDETSAWMERTGGVPDILIPAANERNVRSIIENGFPPLQIYGTTGKNWQAAVIKHEPMKDPCSTCLFPEAQYMPTKCASVSIPENGDSNKQVDAALPFLSFSAGAMAAAEILKLTLPNVPNTPNRVILNTQPTVRAIHAPIAYRQKCNCQHRSKQVHQAMISGGRYYSG